jgi:hypothetical protein
MNQLRPVDKLVVDLAIDNLSDNYSSKPSHISPEFNNVIAAGAQEISGLTLCCAQLGLALVLTADVGHHRHTLLFDAGLKEHSFSGTAGTLVFRWLTSRPSRFRMDIGIIWARCWTRSTI